MSPMDGPFHSLSGHMVRQTTSTSTVPRVGTSSMELLYLFLAFQLVDQIFLPILIATFLLSKSVKRHPVLVNLCVTCIITGIVSSLLWYAGKHIGPEPPNMLCVSQASLLGGVLPMLPLNSMAVMALMFQVNLSIRDPKAQANRMRTYALLIAPYLAFFCFATSAAFFAVQKPQTVTRARRFFYCSFQSPISNAYAIFSALSLLTALGYAGATGVFLRRNWRALRQAGTLDMHFLSRVGVFGVYVFLSLILSVVSIFAPPSPFPDIFAASVGTVLSLILSTQPDVWRAWLRRSKPVPPRIAFSWLSSDMESPKAHDMDLEEDLYVAKDLSSVKEPGAAHISVNLPQQGSRRRLSVAGNDSKAAGSDAGHGVPPPSPYRFARPGMI